MYVYCFKFALFWQSNSRYTAFILLLYMQVHHLSLHDLQARGYVRPVCLCYITNDPEKIMGNFEQLLLAFSLTSHILKYGNNFTFVFDASAHLNFLKHYVVENQQQLQQQYQFQLQQSPQSSDNEHQYQVNDDNNPHSSNSILFEHNGTKLVIEELHHVRTLAVCEPINPAVYHVSLYT